jgi:hypothetical protein
LVLGGSDVSEARVGSGAQLVLFFKESDGGFGIKFEVGVEAVLATFTPLGGSGLAEGLQRGLHGGAQVHVVITLVLAASVFPGGLLVGVAVGAVVEGAGGVVLGELQTVHLLGSSDIRLAFGLLGRFVNGIGLNAQGD